MSNIKKIAKRLFKDPFFWAFIIGIISIYVVKYFALQNRHAPDPLIYLQDWQLIDENGQQLSNIDTKGDVVILSFFFTSCPSICPKLIGAQKQVYERLKHEKDIRFLSVTVDPKRDTSETLKKYKENADIFDERWSFLTGSERAIRQFATDNMKTHLGEREFLDEESSLYDISHRAELFLLDENGNLRGIFTTDNIELAALVRAAKFLLEKK